MPSTYSHYRCGKEVFNNLPKPTQDLIEQYRELYDIGLHGADICLYYEPMTFNAVKKNSFSIHKEYGDELFKKNVARISESIAPNAFKAYLIGFVCHFALDSVCHPYVEKVISLGEVGHTELETDLDRYFMLKDSLDPMTHYPITHINPSDFNSEVIKLFYDEISVKDIKACLEGMIEATKFFHAKTEERLNELYDILRENNCFGPMSGLVMKPSPNPICDKYYALFHKLYNRAVPLGITLINEFVDYLENGAELSDAFHQTFGAGENWQSLSLDI